MEKIIYSNKLKKIIIMMFIIILLFNYIIPTVVFGAATSTVADEAKQLMEAWNNWSATYGNSIIPYMNQGTAESIIMRILQQEYGDNYGEDNIPCYDVISVDGNGNINIRSSYTEQVRNIFNDTNIFPIGGVGDTVFNDGSDYKIMAVEARDEEELEEEQKTQTDEEKIISWLMKNMKIGIDTAKAVVASTENYIVEWNDDGTVKNVTLTEAGLSQVRVVEPNIKVNNEVTANGEGFLDTVGGILLEPVFFLVNFIADALICMLDGIMIDQDFSVIPSAMSSKKIDIDGEPNYTKEITNRVGFANYPTIRYSPEAIFSGKVNGKDISILSIDFISGNSMGEDTPLYEVRKVVASWYKALRLFAIIGLLSVLIYTGIKVMISANAKDKAKYKEWILNWFLAVAILFCMHYIMSFIITVNGEINNLLGNAVSDGVKANVTVNGVEHKFQTNLIGLCRYMVQADSFVTKIGFEVMYIALIVYTFKFTFVYLKRVLNMAFLTLIAPLVALMYPIDKMTDGSAQGFDMWLKEYIFNALLQPMHLLMYYVLVSSAIQVAGDNPIYGIVVLAFMGEAEKLLKKIFGFDKAHGGTVGGMGSAFAAGAIGSQLGNLAKRLSSGNSKGGNGSNGNDKAQELPPTRKDADNVEDNFSGQDGFGGQDEEDNQDEFGNPDGFDNQDGDDDQDEFGGRDGLDNQDGDGGQDEYGEDNDDSEEQTSPADNGEPIEEKASRGSRFAAGAKALGKRIAKPVWNFDDKAKNNRNRLIRKLAKGAAGFSVGATAAAIQAGISITDGKYNPMEGIASFGAGWAGGGRVTDGMIDGGKSLKGTFDQGFHSRDNKDQKEEWEEKQRKRYHEDWYGRDDVNKVFKEKFGEDKFKEMKEKAKAYTDRGYNDPKEVAKLMKASEKLGWDDKKTISTINFKKDLQEHQSYGAVSDLEKQKKYIDSIIKNNNLTGSDATRVRKQYEEAFRSVSQLNKQM